MLCIFGHPDATSCNMLDVVASNLANTTQHVVTGWSNACNMLTLCPQQCCEHVAIKCCSLLAEAFWDLFTCWYSIFNRKASMKTQAYPTVTGVPDYSSECKSEYATQVTVKPQVTVCPSVYYKCLDTNKHSTLTSLTMNTGSPSSLLNFSNS